MENKFLDMLPKTIDYKLDRYQLYYVYVSDKAIDKNNEEDIKIYYKGKTGLLRVKDEVFLKEGKMCYTIYEMLIMIERHIRDIIVSSEDIVDIASYSPILTKLFKNIEELSNIIKEGVIL